MGTGDFKQLIVEARDALDQIVKGNAEGYKELFSKRDDITLGNPFGGFARGRDAVVERLERAASHFRDGEIVSFETVSQHVGEDLAYTVEIERSRTKIDSAADASDVALRVTHIYRREEEGWKLLHRHADPRVSLQTAESILEH